MAVPTEHFNIRFIELRTAPPYSAMWCISNRPAFPHRRQRRHRLNEASSPSSASTAVSSGSAEHHAMGASRATAARSNHTRDQINSRYRFRHRGLPQRRRKVQLPIAGRSLIRRSIIAAWDVKHPAVRGRAHASPRPAPWNIGRLERAYRLSFSKTICTDPRPRPGAHRAPREEVTRRPGNVCNSPNS